MILDELKQRGLVHQCTNEEELAKHFTAGPISFYLGQDPTASSLHLGNLVPIAVMARLAQHGHSPILLVGGATGMIGDPSGKSAERNLLDEEVLATNVASFQKQLNHLVGDAKVVNNRDWFENVSFLDFLRDVGKHLTVNYMIAKESVKTRLNDREQGISYTEFSYMLLQAYDFVALSRSHNCTLQIGGSDQWGNITAGTELSRKTGGPQLYGLTCPLLLDSSGQKMGKTADGEKLWVDRQQTSPYRFYQYLLNRSDEEAPRMLRMFSPRSLSEIKDIEKAHGEAPHKRLAQTALAQDVTSWVHSADDVTRVERASSVLFGGDLSNIDDADLSVLLADVPHSELSLGEGINIIDLLIQTELCSSKGAARRLLSQGGIYINNQRCTEIETLVTESSKATESFVVLRAGKKNYHILRVA